MTRFSPSKNKTLVVTLLTIAAVGSFTTASTARTVTEAAVATDYEGIKKHCEDIHGAGNDKAKSCREALAGGNSVTGQEQRCRDAIKRFEDAQDKFLESCKDAGIPAAGGQCMKRAKKCSDSIDESVASLTDIDEDIDKLDKDDLQYRCEELYNGCPERAKATKEDLDDSRTNLKEEAASQKEQLQSLQDQMMNHQEDTIKDQKNMQDLQQKLKDDETDTMLAIEKRRTQLETQQLQSLQQLRDDYEKIDQGYAAVRTRFNQETDKLRKQERDIIDKCEKLADDTKQAYIHDLKMLKAKGKAIKKSAGQLTGSAKQADKTWNDTYDSCMQRKSTRNERTRIQEERATLQKAMQDEQAMLETKRLNHVSKQKELEMTLAKVHDSEIREANVRLAQATERYNKQANYLGQMQQQRMMKSMDIQNRISQKMAEIANAEKEFKAIERDYSCARSQSNRAGGGSGDDKVNAFLAASDQYSLVRSTCNTANTSCAGTEAGKAFECSAWTEEVSAKSKKPRSSTSTTTNKTD